MQSAYIVYTQITFVFLTLISLKLPVASESDAATSRIFEWRMWGMNWLAF